MGIREWLIPEEKIYFDYFEKEAGIVKKGAKTLLDLTKNYKKLEYYVRKLDELEHESDVVVHDIFTELNKTFITPLDREDICELATKLDDIIDMVDAAARRLLIYKLHNGCPEYLPEFAKLIYEGAKYVERCIKCLRTTKEFSKLEKGCIKINDIENEGDVLLASSLGELFEHEDVKYIIKMKDIYDLLEFATDKCEEVAHILQGIVIKEG